MAIDRSRCRARTVRRRSPKPRVPNRSCTPTEGRASHASSSRGRGTNIGALDVEVREVERDLVLLRRRLDLPHALLVRRVHAREVGRLDRAVRLLQVAAARRCTQSYASHGLDASHG